MVCTKLVRCALFSIALFLGFVAEAAARDDLEIVEAVWTSAIKDRSPVDQLATSVSKPPLVLWTRMRGTQSALATLKTSGKLPIRHRWTRFVGSSGETVRSVMTDDISGDIGSAAKASELEREIAARTFFDWRFWSEKKNADLGQWEVEIVFANGDPVLCRNTSNSQEPCKFSIVVR